MELIVCAIFKNEAHILEEWITHYLYHGVDHIYLVNDFSSDKYQSIIDKFSDKVTLFHNDIVVKTCGRQAMIQMKYFAPIIHKAKWAAILDLDEFLYSPEEIDIKKIIRRYENYSQIVVNWVLFGSNYHLYQPRGVVSGFTRRPRIISDPSYKSILRTDSFINFDGVHKFPIRGETVWLRTSETNSAPLLINHYMIQSQQFYLEIKQTRGDCDNWFDTHNLTRNKEMFDRFDINDVEDLRLYNQNKEIYKGLEKIDMNSDDITFIITSCNRPHLLDQTLQSFVEMNTYPIQMTYIIDDSGIQGCNDTVIEKYREQLNIRSIYNKKNIGQIESIDRVYSYVRTKWIFHCEEDWRFLQKGFIEKSMDIFKQNPEEKIFTVWLRAHNDSSGHPVIKIGDNNFIMQKDFSYMDRGKRYTWGGITFNPGLRKTEVALKYYPYSLTCEKEEEKNYIVGEYTVNKKYVEDGYYSRTLSDPSGHITHIGWHDHIKRPWD